MLWREGTGGSVARVERNMQKDREGCWIHFLVVVTFFCLSEDARRVFMEEEIVE